MVEMTRKEILPAVSEYSQMLASTVLSKKSVCESLDCAYETETLEEISTLTGSAHAYVKVLEQRLDGIQKSEGVAKLSLYYKDKILPIMKNLRESADKLERLVSAEYWPMPTYGDLLFGI